jgi:Uma2 family endonuclease
MDVEQVLIESPAVEDESSRLRMSYEEYLAWADEDVHAEWVARPGEEVGEVIVHMPPKKLHQMLVGFLHHIIGLFVAIFDLGVLQVAPFEVRLSPDGPSREPDLLFLSRAHFERLTPERLVGPPDLAVEIVSDDSVHRDRVDKFDEYEAAGVPEYWVLDNRPEEQRAWFYQLDPSGRYQSVPVGTDGVYSSAALPGFELRVEWLWQEEPDVLAALAAVIGPERFLEALRVKREA